MTLKFKKGLWRDFVRVCIPRNCVMCGKSLSIHDRFLCPSCQMNLPRTNLHLEEENNLEKMFWGILPIVRATSFIYYYRGNASRNILINLKYYHTPKIGEYMGKLMAREIKESGFFNDIDYIIPIPLARRRLRQRGYNQVEAIARGVSDITGIPVLRDAVARTAETPSQTTVQPEERSTNVMSAFKAVKLDELEGKHILLMDDVVTTGATLSACGKALTEVKDIKISILTLAMAPSF